MVYSGTGTFLEKDEAARRFVIDAKGKDKRGNGTAGAKVTATFAEEGSDSTRVDVVTDLAITGKPAQFGRGVIEDVSNKLLDQFVACLKDKVGAPAPAPAEPEPAAAASEAPAAAASVPSAPSSPVASSAPRPSPSASTSASGSSSDDNALDLGATVIPILAKTYGPQAAIALVALIIGWLIGRRRS
jgi:hypothetical protein